MIKRIALLALFCFGNFVSEIQAGRYVTKDATPQQSPTATSTPSTMISAGDTLSISVFPATEYTKEVTVSPDGTVEMALIGSVLIKGLTSAEAQELIRRKYARYIANPQIAINVRHFAGRKVAIIGEVRAAGYYEYRDGMKMLDLVALANGFNDAAKITDVWILRQDPSGRNLSFRYNYKKVLRGNPGKDIVLAAGDTIYVPKSVIYASGSFVNVNILPWVSLAVGALTIVLAEQALKRQ